MQCTNFRDWSASLSSILDSVSCDNGQLTLKDPNIIPPRKTVYRGGSIRYVRDCDIGYPRTIINLRMEPDEENIPQVQYFHMGKEKDMDSYNVTDRNVRKWLCDVLKVLQREDIEFPILIHCHSGKDRTGVVLGCLGLVLGIPIDLLVAEFSISKGLRQPSDADLFRCAMQSINRFGVDQYFRDVDLSQIRSNLLQEK